MTVEELQQRGYRFTPTLRYYRQSSQPNVVTYQVSFIIGSSRIEFDEKFTGENRADVLEAARLRACGHFIEMRLAQKS